MLRCTLLWHVLFVVFIRFVSVCVVGFVCCLFSCVCDCVIVCMFDWVAVVWLVCGLLCLSLFCVFVLLVLPHPVCVCVCMIGCVCVCVCV